MSLTRARDMRGRAQGHSSAVSHHLSLYTFTSGVTQSSSRTRPRPRPRQP